MDAKTGDIGGCPMKGTKARSLLGRTNKDWWPEALPVDMLHAAGVHPSAQLVPLAGAASRLFTSSYGQFPQLNRRVKRKPSRQADDTAVVAAL